MVALKWLRGLIAHRPVRLVATALGVAVGVALIASIGAFLSSTNAKMTQRAIARVAIDWQVEAQPGANPRAVLSTVRELSGRQAGAARSVRHVARPERNHGRLHADDRRGPRARDPRRVRRGLPGRVAPAVRQPQRRPRRPADGVEPARRPGQHGHDRSAGREARQGDRRRRRRSPYADSLFQKVGAPPGSQLSAPPDNVILLPQARFAAVQAPIIRSRPELIHTQVHVRLSHALAEQPERRV